MSRFNVIVSGVGKKELTNHKTLFSSLASSQNGKIWPISEVNFKHSKYKVDDDLSIFYRL